MYTYLWWRVYNKNVLEFAKKKVPALHYLGEIFFTPKASCFLNKKTKDYYCSTSPVEL